MFRFEEPAYLYLLLLLPLLAAFYLYSNYRRRKAIRKFGDPILMAQLMPDVSKYRPDVKFWLVFAAIGLFTVLLFICSIHVKFKAKIYISNCFFRDFLSTSDKKCTFRSLKQSFRKEEVGI